MIRFIHKPVTAVTLAATVLICVGLLAMIYGGAAWNLSSFQWGCVFLVTIVAIAGLNKANRVSTLSATSLFIWTAALFLGGRYLAALINPDTTIFNIDFFVKETLSSKQATQLTLLVVLALSSVCVGQYLALLSTTGASRSKDFSGDRHIVQNRKMSRVLFIAWIILAMILIPNLLSALTDVIRSGYLALYAYQGNGEGGSRFMSLSSTFLYVLVGIAIAYGNKKQKTMYLLLLLFYTFTYLVMGQRGRFGAFIIFGLWLYGDYGRRRFSFVKLVGVMLLIIILLTGFVEYFSYREFGTHVGLVKTIGAFFESQGTTLMVLHLSTTVSHYPALAYIQELIPGSSFVADLFSDAQATTFGFGYYLASHLNRTAYLSGHGLGWSIFSDFYVFGLRSPVLYALLCSVFGFVLTYMERASRNSKRVLAIFVAILPAVFIVARGSLAGVIPLAWYAIVINFFVWRISPRKTQRLRWPDQVGQRGKWHGGLHEGQDSPAAGG